MISRRNALRRGVGLAALATVGAPAILHAQTKTLKITTWGGKWGEIMKATVLPALDM
jgi:putative spermidine/putrescine transport system substrate-binding protein